MAKCNRCGRTGRGRPRTDCSTNSCVPQPEDKPQVDGSTGVEETTAPPAALQGGDRFFVNGWLYCHWHGTADEVGMHRHCQLCTRPLTTPAK